MRIGWYLNRLRSMDAGEIVFRAGQWLKRRGPRADRRGWSAFAATDAPLRLPADLRARFSRPLPPDVQGRVDATRAMVKTGRFAFLGAEWPAMSGGQGDTPWLKDPVSGRDWPGSERYCFDVGYRHDAERGDVKFVWELNRLQVLPGMCAAGDAASAAAFMAILRSWMAANPPFRGVNWNSGIELALRIVSVVTALLLLPDLEPADRAEVRRFLLAHAVWLHRFPSLHSSANNHRIAEGLGLLLVALVAPDLADAKRWRAEGCAIIERETLEQFAPDGVGLEQSPTYTAFSAEMVCLADLFAASSSAPLDPAVRGRLAAVAAWLQAITDDGGNVPRIGDDDEGRVIALPPDREPRYVASVLAAIAGHLGRPDLAPPARDAHLRDLLFRSPDAPAHAPAGMRDFADGGYAVVREAQSGRRALLVFDHGPLGYLSIAAHGHADALALWLHLDGLPVIVDAGTFLYHSGGAWRDAMRGTPVHNTVTVGDADSSEIAGPFMWGKRADSRLVERRDGPDWSLLGRHDGYRASFGVDHERRISRTPDGFAIGDRLVGDGGARPAAISLLFNPACTVECAGAAGFLVSRAGEPLLEIDPPVGSTAELVFGDEARRLGWYSPRFGERRPASQLIMRGDVGGDWVMTEIRVLPAHPFGTSAPEGPS